MPTGKTTARTLASERQALQKQLRLIFIYPIVYLAMWTPSFCLSSMQYTKKYAQRFPPVLAFIATTCSTSMGFVNCVIFLWREKPWRQRREYIL